MARTSANQEWALDFAHDAVACGRTIRVLSVVDAYTRECLALEVDTSFASRRVTRVLEAIVAARYGGPTCKYLSSSSKEDSCICSGHMKRVSNAAEYINHFRYGSPIIIGSAVCGICSITLLFSYRAGSLKRSARRHIDGYRPED